MEVNILELSIYQLIYSVSREVVALKLVIEKHKVL